MKKLYILVSFLFIFTGCSTTVPVVTKYKISSNSNLKAQDDSSCKKKSVKVTSALASSSLMSKDMSYVKGGVKVFKYSESAWLNNPNRSVSRELINMLREIGIYKSVQESTSRSRADLIVESTLEEFMQYYSDDLKISYALVEINFSVIDSKTSNVISTKKFSSKVDIKTLDAQGGVDGLNLALKNILDESSKWFIGVCK
jgi:cholesterol transport system auxiliary component